MDTGAIELYSDTDGESTLVNQDGVDTSSAGAVAVIDTDLYEFDGDWERGAAAGTLHASCVTFPDGRAMWQLLFDIDSPRYGKGTIVAAGRLPLRPDGPGAGSVPVTGWAGDVGSRRTVTIGVRNPKRYSIET